jgi:hypothetical protein
MLMVTLLQLLLSTLALQKSMASRWKSWKRDLEQAPPQARKLDEWIEP